LRFISLYSSEREFTTSVERRQESIEEIESHVTLMRKSTNSHLTFDLDCTDSIHVSSPEIILRDLTSPKLNGIVFLTLKPAS